MNSSSVTVIGGGGSGGSGGNVGGGSGCGGSYVAPTTSSPVSPGVVISVGGGGKFSYNPQQWELKIPEHIKKQFDMVYVEEVRRYVKENILRQNIVIHAVFPFKNDYGHESDGLMVVFNTAMEALAGDEKV